MTTDHPVSLETALAAATARLAAAGCEAPRREARLLAVHGAGLPLDAQIRDPRQPLGADRYASLQELVRRRAAREPLAYLTGEREFWSLPFQVTPDVLIPRPDSETVIAAALAAAETAPAATRVLDFGTGSGCLLLALLHTWPHARGLGVDMDRAALRVARTNARRLGLAGRCRFVEGNWWQAGLVGTEGPLTAGIWDVVLANPPYIPGGDLASLAPEIRHEPRHALDGGPDGLDAWRALLPAIHTALTPEGFAVVELGAGQANAVTTLAHTTHLTVTSHHHDLATHTRCLTLVRCPD